MRARIELTADEVKEWLKSVAATHGAKAGHFVDVEFVFSDGEGMRAFMSGVPSATLLVSSEADG